LYTTACSIHSVDNIAAVCGNGVRAAYGWIIVMCCLLTSMMVMMMMMMMMMIAL